MLFPFNFLWVVESFINCFLSKNWIDKVFLITITVNILILEEFLFLFINDFNVSSRYDMSPSLIVDDSMPSESDVQC